MIGDPAAIAATVPEAIRSTGKLVVGINEPYAPAEFRDADGHLTGFDVDLMNAVAHVLDLGNRRHVVDGHDPKHPGRVNRLQLSFQRVAECVYPPDGVPLIELHPRTGAATDGDEVARPEQHALHAVLAAADPQGVDHRPFRHDRQGRGARELDLGRDGRLRGGRRRVTQNTGHDDRRQDKDRTASHSNLLKI